MIVGAAGGIRIPDPRFRRHIPQLTTRGFPAKYSPNRLKSVHPSSRVFNTISTSISASRQKLYSPTLSTRNEIRTSAPHSSRLSPRNPTDTTSSPLILRKVARASVNAFWTASSELEDDLPIISMTLTTLIAPLFRSQALRQPRRPSYRHYRPVGDVIVSQILPLRV